MQKLHWIFALLGLLGCVHLHAVPLWPGEIVHATSEPDRFQLALGAAATAAARAGAFGELQELHAAGALEFEAQDEYARNMLYAAAEAGQVEVLRWLLAADGGSLGEARHGSIAGRTPLELAAENGHTEAATLLLNAGETPPELVRLAAERAVREGHRSTAMRLLIDQDVDLERSVLLMTGIGHENHALAVLRGLTPKRNELFAIGETLVARDRLYVLQQLLADPGELGAGNVQLLARYCVAAVIQSREQPPSWLRDAVTGFDPAQLTENGETWPAQWLRAVQRATQTTDGATERLWELGRETGWNAGADPAQLLPTAAAARKPQNLRYLLEIARDRLDEQAKRELTAAALEQMDLTALGIMQEHWPVVEIINTMTARQIFDRYFWDNVEPPSPTLLPYLKARASQGKPPLAWELRHAEKSAERLAYLRGLHAMGARLDAGRFEADDMGPVLRSALWLLDHPLYRELAALCPVPSTWQDDVGWTLRDWERWCGVER